MNIVVVYYFLPSPPAPLPQERGEKRYPQGSLSHWERVGVRVSLKKSEQQSNFQMFHRWTSGV
jgi:hypothetical protein